jgi:hypothetical protein
LIQRLAADAELARKRSFLLAVTGAAAQLDNLVVHQRLLAAAIRAALLGQRDPQLRADGFEVRDEGRVNVLPLLCSIQR